MRTLTHFRTDFLDKLVNLDVEGAMAVIEAAIDSGAKPGDILLNVVNAGMKEVGIKQADKEITLSEIYVIARIADAAIERLLKLFPEKPATEGRVVIGTALGDYHGLGRKIVASFLRAENFEVIDLGMSVKPSTFVDTAVEKKAQAICVSALLLHTAQGIKDINALLVERDLKDKIKLIVGGAALNFDRRLYRELGADATARNASDAVRVVRLAIGAKG